MANLKSIIVTAVFYMVASQSLAQNNILLSPVINEQGIIYPDNNIYTITNAVLPDASKVSIPLMPLSFVQNTLVSNDVLATSNSSEPLFTGEAAIFELNTQTKQITYIPPVYTLKPEAIAALNKSPKWIRNDLLRQFRKLNKYNLDDDFAQLINNASEKITDEVAFVIANMPTEALRDSRLRQDKELIVRNAQFIYDVVDSLKYVRLKEYGSFAAKDYYTTTEYRIVNGAGSHDTIWVEIPRDIYYWYVVHPKLQYEGVYSTDDASNTGQRTYGYFWREFLWNNPSAAWDYRVVNKSTTYGKVDSIPKFSVIAKMPEVLWDRNENYYFFQRPYLPSNTALDIIGNWASQAVPVDATNPRTVQPNQVAIKNEGNCGEDSYILGGACRTALIPVMLEGTDGEDHLWCSFYDPYANRTWHHYEFFRGGLMRENKGWGFTSFMKDGSYETSGWVISLINSYRPDTWSWGRTSDYTDTCSLKISVTDKNGNAVDGVRILLYCKPGPYYNTGWQKAGFGWTDSKGSCYFTVGEGKQYSYQLYHTKYGYLPSSTTANIITTAKALKGFSYSSSASYTNDSIPSLQVANNLNVPASGNYGVHISWTANEIIHGTNDGDGQKGVFSYTEPDYGMVSVFLCDESNYQKYTSGQSFDAYSYIARITAGNLYLPFPSDGKWYVVLANKQTTVNSQLLSANCELLQNPVLAGLEEFHQVKSNSIQVYPDPFNEKCNIISADKITKVEIYDLFGKKVKELNEFPFSWQPADNLPAGIYIIKANGYNYNASVRVYYSK